VWEEAAPAQNLGEVVYTLHKVMTALRRWSLDKFGAVMKELESIRTKIEQLSSHNHSENQSEVDRLSTHMDELLYREEIIRLQRSTGRLQAVRRKIE
jgi:hypothetical protein